MITIRCASVRHAVGLLEMKPGMSGHDNGPHLVFNISKCFS